MSSRDTWNSSVLTAPFWYKICQWCYNVHVYVTLQVHWNVHKMSLALQWLSQLVCVTIRSYGVIQEFDLYRQKCSKLGCLDVVEHKSLCLVQYCIINKYL